MTGSGWRGATGPSSARNSDRSRTRALSAAARPAQPRSCPSRPSSRSYSFMAEPQPAELTTIASTPARSNVSIVCRAKATASASRPECSDSAPQQPWPRGMITSQPSVARTRAVAAFTCGKNTDWTHPVSMPTTARRGPRAATRSGSRDPGRRRRGQLQRRAQSGGEPPRQAAAGQPPVQPGPLRRTKRPGHRPQPPRVREQREDRRPRRPIPRPGHTAAAKARTSATHGRGLGPRLFGPDPGHLDELVVLHAGRAGGHARHAAQAAVEVLGRRRGHLGALQDLIDQVDPAAR